MKTDSLSSLLTASPGPRQIYVEKGDGPTKSVMRGKRSLYRALLSETEKKTSIMDLCRKLDFDFELGYAAVKLEAETGIPGPIWAMANVTGQTENVLHPFLLSLPFPAKLPVRENLSPAPDTALEAVTRLRQDASLWGVQDREDEKHFAMGHALDLAAEIIINQEVPLHDEEAMEEELMQLNRIVNADNEFSELEEAADGLEYFVAAMDALTENTPSSQVQAVDCLLEMARRVGEKSKAERYEKQVTDQFIESSCAWASSLAPMDPIR